MRFILDIHYTLKPPMPTVFKQNCWDNIHPVLYSLSKCTHVSTFLFIHLLIFDFDQLSNPSPFLQSKFSFREFLWAGLMRRLSAFNSVVSILYPPCTLSLTSLTRLFFVRHRLRSAELRNVFGTWLTRQTLRGTFTPISPFADSESRLNWYFWSVCCLVWFRTAYNYMNQKAKSDEAVCGDENILVKLLKSMSNIETAPSKWLFNYRNIFKHLARRSQHLFSLFIWWSKYPEHMAFLQLGPALPV